MHEAKKGLLPMPHGIHLSKTQGPSTPDEQRSMDKIPYASSIGSMMFAMVCTRQDIS